MIALATRRDPGGQRAQHPALGASGSGPRAIEILPDLSRRTPVVDPDDHHLFVSLGCALETPAAGGAWLRLGGGPGDPARRGASASRSPACRPATTPCSRRYPPPRVDADGI
ncbi:hypothetical protein ACRAWD_24530 [Caulobacter segnis]